MKRDNQMIVRSIALAAAFLFVIPTPGSAFADSSGGASSRRNTVLQAGRFVRRQVRRLNPVRLARSLRTGARATQSHEPQAYPGAIDAIRELHGDGLVLGVITNNSTTKAHGFNARNGIAPLFRFTIGARNSNGEIGRPIKPAVDMYQSMAASFGMQPDEIVFVGDSVFDVVGARRAGMAAIAVTEGSDTPAQFEALPSGEQPHVYVRAVSELPRVIARMNRARLQQGRRPIRGVGLDMDGTYVDSWSEYREAYLQAAAEVGVPTDAATLDAATGLDRRAFSARHDQFIGELAARQLGAAPQDLAERFKSAFNRAYNQRRAAAPSGAGTSATENPTAPTGFRAVRASLNTAFRAAHAHRFPIALNTTLAGLAGPALSSLGLDPELGRQGLLLAQLGAGALTGVVLNDFVGGFRSVEVPEAASIAERFKLRMNAGLSAIKGAGPVSLIFGGLVMQFSSPELRVPGTVLNVLGTALSVGSVGRDVVASVRGSQSPTR